MLLIIPHKHLQTIRQQQQSIIHGRSNLLFTHHCNSTIPHKHLQHLQSIAIIHGWYVILNAKGVYWWGGWHKQYIYMVPWRPPSKIYRFHVFLIHWCQMWGGYHICAYAAYA